jgi:hypothetical protein
MRTGNDQECYQYRICRAEARNLQRNHRQTTHRTRNSQIHPRHISRGLPGVKTIIGNPRETERVEVDPAAINRWYEELKEKVREIPASFVFNVDESGCCEYADARELRVLVPDDYEHDTIPVPVDRNTKRSTLVACITADGFRFKPFIIVDRVTAEKELPMYGYHARNVALNFQENAYMNTPLFEKWAHEVFFPQVEERRRELHYAGRALLLLDGLGSHHTDAFLQECEERGIGVFFFVPHSSDQTQPLDLVTFGLLKQYFSASRFHALENPQSNKVVKILGAWFASSAPHHNVEAFINLGLIPTMIGDEVFLKVDREHARRVRNYEGNRPDLGREGQQRFRLNAANPPPANARAPRGRQNRT